MTYKSDDELNKSVSNEASDERIEGVPTRSVDERVKDALSQVQAELEAGTSISDIMNQDPEERRARELGIAYLSYRPRSSGQVIDKLIEKGIDAQVAKRVVTHLIRDGYIDDRKIAYQLLRERRSRKAEGYRKAEQRLIAFGIPRYVAVDAIERARLEFPEIQLLAIFLKSKFRRELRSLRDSVVDAETAEQIRMKMLRSAQNRGFMISDCFKLFNIWDIDRGR